MALALTGVLCPSLMPPAMAAGAAGLDGRSLGAAWIAPFAGLLLSIALLPLAAPRFWRRHHGKVSAAWSLVLMIPLAGRAGIAVTAHEVLHALLAEYLPFIILLLALFTVAGGVRLTGRLAGSAFNNTAFLAAGTLLASIAGTTGASMLLIRPLIAANRARRRNVHVFVFFIFLVGNVGGALTPIGDPPLFLGFLAGVSFFWPTLHLLAPTALMASALLVIFYLIDSVLGRREPAVPEPEPAGRLDLEGKRNLLLLVGAVSAVIMSGLWDSKVRVSVLGVELKGESLLRDALLLLITVVSLRITHATIRECNGFSWEPIREVAKLFAGLFLTIIPAIAILRAGPAGALAPWIEVLAGPDGHPVHAAYFWLTGMISSLLDNAPTYLMFFNMAGGGADRLMGPLSGTLVAISAGAVFMGAMTYIGNAPNFMVKSMCEERGIRMPSFFGYLAWSLGILVPLLALLTAVFFRP